MLDTHLIKIPSICPVALFPDKIQLTKTLESMASFRDDNEVQRTLRHWKSPTMSTFKEQTEVLSSMGGYEGQSGWAGRWGHS